MARLDALSIELLTEGKDKTKEEYGKVIENIQAITLANVLKNKDLSGDPTSGSVEAKRFCNISGKTYGTARSNGAGQKVKVKPVTIQIDDDQEYIEEVESKDIAFYGVNGLIEIRSKNHGMAEAVDEDTKFFKEAVNKGTSFVTTKSTKVEEISEAIIKIEKTKNEFVNGVPRNMINVVCSPEYYDAVRTDINSTPNSNGLGSMANYEQGIFKNTKIFSTAFLPEGIDYVVMVDGAVAQPVRSSVLEPEKIGLSEAIGFGLFTNKGTQAVMEDLIIYSGTIASL